MQFRPSKNLIAISLAIALPLTSITLVVAYFIGRNRLLDRARLKAELTQKVLGETPEVKIKDAIAEAFRTTERTVPAIKTDITESAVMTSRTYYAEKLDLRTRLQADVAKVLVSPGDTVKKGQPLCILQHETAFSLLNQARLDLALQEARLQKLYTPGSSSVSPQDVETLKLKVRQAEIALELKQIEAKKLAITAPSAGRLVSLKVKSGDYVVSGQSIATLFDDSRILVVASVPQAEITEIEIGTTATAAFGTNLPSATGKVTAIGMEGSLVGRNIMIPVTVEIGNAAGVYKSGMAANVTFLTDAETPVSAAGTCAPGARVDVKSMATGTVNTELSREGDRVVQGQVLVDLSNRAVTLGVDQAANDLAIARAALEKLESQQPVEEEDVLAQELKVEQARFALRERQADVDSLQILSPFDGVVSRVTVRPGDRLASGAVVLSVQNPGKLLVQVQIPEMYAPKVYKGQQADVLFDYLGDVPYVGTIVQIDSEGQAKEKSAVFDAVIEVAKPLAIRPGMTAKVTINTEIRESVIAIPARIVAQAGQDKVVTVLREDKKDFWRRLVPKTVVIQTGITDGILVEVTCGLEDGEELIVPETK